VFDDRELLPAKAVEAENLAEHFLRAAFALAVHRQTRYIVSGGPARGEIPGITRNTPSSAKFYTSHTSPAAASKTLLTPGGWVATRARRICLRCSIRTLADTFAVTAQIRLILTR